MKQQTLFRVLLFLYSVMLLYFMFAGFHRSIHSNYRYNLIPFHTISAYVRNLSLDNVIDTSINLIGNIAVFIPLGFLIPASKSHPWSYGRFILFFSSFIILLECMQTFLRVGTGDIDDLLLNVIGGSVGYVLFSQYKKMSFIDHQKT
ncbi:VanZ family protein [Paenibacillus gallinarum]|uniref:VanZ family protein n=1 Tax=Paenibacillus gallinarum TaxID=2762232 RepID=A0ABR8STI8_9BACL|nr:VanZ family protein [Paenibacillus gallinarum]MBD7966812.1 VanZ family protein [Paenibacillus gallinarum]